jgi:hypothetical protein
VVSTTNFPSDPFFTVFSLLTFLEIFIFRDQARKYYITNKTPVYHFTFFASSLVTGIFLCVIMYNSDLNLILRYDKFKGIQSSIASKGSKNYVDMLTFFQKRRPFSYQFPHLNFELEDEEDRSGGFTHSPFRLKLGYEPQAEPEPSSSSYFNVKSLHYKSSLYEDDPNEPMAENEVDFQPLLNPQLGLRRDEAGGSTSSRLEIQPGHQHKTVSSLHNPSITFVSPPPDQQHIVHSAPLQVNNCF